MQHILDIEKKVRRVWINGQLHNITYAVTGHGEIVLFAPSCLAPILDCSKNFVSSMVGRCAVTNHGERYIIDYLKEPLKFNSYLMERQCVLTLEGVKAFINNSNNYKLGEKYYRKKKNMLDKTSIKAVISKYKKEVILAIENEVEDMLQELQAPEVVGMSQASSTSEGGATVEHTGTAATPNIDSNITTVGFWNGLPAQHSPEYEQAVELYFASEAIIDVQACISKVEQRWRSEDEAAYISAKATETVVGGYCYAAWNPLFGHLMKLGATTRSPAIRLRELSNAGVPEPFQLVASLQCVDPFRMESKIHKHFASVRKYGKKKEFFTLSWEQVSDYFQSLEVEAMTEYLDERKAMENLRKRKRTELEHARASRRVV